MKATEEERAERLRRHAIARAEERLEAVRLRYERAEAELEGARAERAAEVVEAKKLLSDRRVGALVGLSHVSVGKL